MSGLQKKVAELTETVQDLTETLVRTIAVPLLYRIRLLVRCAMSRYGVSIPPPCTYLQVLGIYLSCSI